MLAIVDRAADLDARLRDITAERDAIRAKVNEMSKDVGRLRRGGVAADIAAAESLQAESRALGDQEKILAAEHDAVSGALRDDPPRDPQPAASRRPRWRR